MAVSRLEIFKTVLKPEKNAKIESIDHFLDNENYSIKVYDNSTYQYQKIALNDTMKITVDQADSNGLSVGNYIRLTQDGRKYYYFILSSEWTSVNSCKLHCALDTINTFADELEWSDKTQIIRQHGPRFKKVQLTANKTHTVSSSFDGPIKELQYQFTIPQLKNAKFISITASYVDAANAADLIDIIMDNFNPNTGLITFTETYAKKLNYPKFSGQATVSIKYECYKRNIDLTAEGINPQLYGEDQGLIYSNNDPDSWYVIYNSAADGGTQQIETLLCKDTGFTALISSTTTTSAMFTHDKIGNDYYFIDPFNGKGSFVNTTPYWHGWVGEVQPQIIADGSGATILKTDCVRSISSQFDKTDLISCVFTKENTKIRVYRVSFRVSGKSSSGYALTATEVVNVGAYDKIIVSSGSVFKVFKSTVRPVNKSDITLYTQYINSPLFPISGTEKSPKYIDGIDKLIKTNPTLIKVIKFPYCPISYKIDAGGKYDFEYNVVAKDVKASLGGVYLKLSDEFDFGTIITTSMASPLQKANEQVKLTPSVFDTKKIENESKLYHSEFYQPKFIYDNFGFLFDLEKLENQDTHDNLLLSFTPSRTFNSTMMFKFPDYITKGKDTEDFNNILIANRNNEIPIFNSEYLNYVKFGENYDQKVKNTQLGYGIAKSVVSAAGTVGGLWWGGAFDRYDFEFGGGKKLADGTTALGPISLKELDVGTNIVKAGGIRSATSFINNAIGLAEQTQLTQMGIEHKKELLANQAISVSNCDSIDLLQKYSENKAKIKLYTPEETIKDKVFDLFYYCGYNRGNRDIPDTHSRYWFNYIQCIPEFKGINSVVYDNFIDDIKSRYEQGITVYHYHPDFANSYDIDQEHENWETFLLA